MAFVLGLLGLGVAFWFLLRLKQRDVAQCREILGLESVASPTSHGTTPEGFAPSSTAGRLALGLMLGTFYLNGATAQYAVFGSPTKATAEHVKAAAPLLLDLAAAAGA